MMTSSPMRTECSPCVRHIPSWGKFAQISRNICCGAGWQVGDELTIAVFNTQDRTRSAEEMCTSCRHVSTRAHTDASEKAMAAGERMQKDVARYTSRFSMC